MKKHILIFLLLFGFLSGTAIAQTIDTMITVGNGQQMHFTIIKGTNPPILFESGLGNGGDVWKVITKEIAEVTGATVITYDRLSYGEKPENYQIGFENELKALENGLSKLGYATKNMMSVSHSLGGMYQSYYASRHPKEVKAAVFIDDANVCSLTAYFKMINTPPTNDVDKYIAEILETVRKNPMPLNIPLIDIVAVGHTDENGDMDTVWQNCHAQFVAASPERKLLLAYGVGHAIFVDNPTLVINAIVTQYANYVVPKQKAILLERANTLALKMANENKKNEIKCGQSEDDLTTWGYSFLEKNETEKAIEIFKLNVLLNPEGWNTYDCLGEAYLKAGKTDLAILNYKKSLELNPKNENATKMLKDLQK